MEFDVSGRSYPGRQLGQIIIPPDLFQFPTLLQCLAHREQIHRVIVQEQLMNGPEYLLMRILIKSIRFQHQGSQYCFFQIDGLWGHFPIFRLQIFYASTRIKIRFFCHNQ